MSQRREAMRRRLCSELGPVHLGEVGLLEVGLDELAGRVLAGPGDRPHLDAFEHPYPRGDPETVAEGEQPGVVDEGAEDPPAGARRQLLRRAVEAQPSAVEEEETPGGGLNVARDVGREDDDALAGLFEEDLAEAAPRLDVEAGCG